MAKKLRYCVAGEFMGRCISKPGFITRHEAYQYAALKGWTDFIVRCEGSIEVEPA